MDKEVKGWIIFATATVLVTAILVFGLIFGMAFYKSVEVPQTVAEVHACQTLPLDARVLCLNHLEGGT